MLLKFCPSKAQQKFMKVAYPLIHGMSLKGVTKGTHSFHPETLETQAWFEPLGSGHLKA